MSCKLVKNARKRRAETSQKLPDKDIINIRRLIEARIPDPVVRGRYIQALMTEFGEKT
jgi:hypothetical protein